MQPQRFNRKTLMSRKENRGLKGMPEGYVYVGQTTSWACRYIPHKLFDGAWGVVDLYDTHHWYAKGMPENVARETAVSLYEENLRFDPRYKLRGKHLVCDCRPDQPCHADALLKLANR